jgi:geranylgeranyl transferase type-2 subunit beta
VALLSGCFADVAGLQQPDGSFWGDEWGETDTRFSYCALCALWLLDRMDAVDVGAAARYVAACRNFDGGFGSTPGMMALVACNWVL